MDTNTAQTIIRSEMHAHGLTQQGWKFVWDRAKRRRGSACSATKTITLSLPLTQLRDEMDVRKTITHEIAHAIVGTQHGHNAIWRRQFISMGGDGSRCSQDRIDPALTAKYAVKCSVDGRTLGHVNRKGHRLAASLCKCHMRELNWVTLR